jgi:hypothetical protein
MMKFLRAIGGLALLIFLAWALSSQRGNSPTPTQDETVIAARDRLEAQEMPSDEKTFVDAIVQARLTYRQAANDLAKGGTRSARAIAVCQLFGRRQTFDGWIGIVETLSSNSEGKGVLKIRIGPDIHVGTWNNSLSDIGDHTLIDPTSSLFADLSAMFTGQIVKFDGRFIASETDCVRESSMTLGGSMTKPDYIVRFQRVEAVRQKAEQEASDLRQFKAGDCDPYEEALCPFDDDYSRSQVERNIKDLGYGQEN